VLRTSSCSNRCSYSRQHATDLSMPIFGSEMERRVLPLSLCLDGCPCFRQHATDFSMPIFCSEMEGRVLMLIPDIYLRFTRH
jgi:hypothetical protein